MQTGNSVSFDEAKDKIKEAMFDREIQKQLDLYIENLRMNSHIDIRSVDLKE